MAADNVTVIEVTARVKDETQSGAAGATATVSKLEKAMKKAQANIDKMKKMSKIELAITAADKASKVLNGVWSLGRKIGGKAVSITLKAVDLVTAPVRGIMRMLANPVVAFAGITGVSLGIGDLVNTFKDFEQGMANVKAIIRGTDEDMAALTNTAKQLGESTMFSAKQASEAMEYLAMAGWKTGDITNGMPGLLDLAAAGGVNLATAADVVSSALAQFNMQANESTRVADVLAAAATNSKTDVQGLGESLKYAGTQAGALGYSVEDTALALGLMGNAGIDSSSAGTALRTTLARMAQQGELTGDEAKGVAKEMNKLGVSLTDSTGKAKPLMEVMRELRKGFSHLTQAEKVQTAANLAGLHAQSGLLAIVNASDEKFNQLADAVYNAAGAAKEMAETRMDTLQGSMLYLQSAAEGVKIAFGDKLGPYLKNFVDWVTSKMPQIKEVALDIADSIGKAIDKTVESLKTLTESGEWQNADGFWEKAKVAWDKLIAEPFDKWWNSKGQAWLAKKAEIIGRGLGGFITAGLSALFGENSVGTAEDGINIGKSVGHCFMEGFLDGFDVQKAAEALKNVFDIALKLVFSNPVTGTMAAAFIGSKVLSGVSGALSLVQNARPLLTAANDLIGTIAPVTTAVPPVMSAASGKLIPAAASIAKVSAPVMGVAGGVAGGITFGSGIKDSIKANKIEASGGDEREQKMYKDSSVWKTGGVASGAAAGATIGALIGTPFFGVGAGVGALVGAGIGAGVGAIVGNTGASHAKKKYEEELKKENEEKAAAMLAREQAKYKEYDLKAMLEDTSVSAEEFEKKFRTKVLDGLKKGFGNVKMSLEDISDMAKHLVFGDAEKSLKSFSNAAAKAKQDFEGLSNTAEELKRLNWKSTLSYEGKMKWSEADNAQFISAAESMISQAQQYLEDKQFEAQMAVNLIFGENSETGAGIMEGLNGMYSQLQSKVGELSKEAKIILSKDGMLTFEEQTEVNNLLGQITEITNMLNESDDEAKLDLLTVKYGGSQMDFESFSQLQQQIPEYLNNLTTGLDEAYYITVRNIRIRAEQDPDYDPTSDLEAAAQEYAKKYQEALQKVIDYQMEQITVALNNDESVNVDDILPNLEGDVSTRLQTAIGEALKEKPDVASWDTDYWMQILGLGDDKTLADKLGTVLTPVAKQMALGLSNAITPEEMAATLQGGVENMKTGVGAAIEANADGFKEAGKPAAQSAVLGVAEEFASEETKTVMAQGVENVRVSTEAAAQASAENFASVLNAPAQSMLSGFASAVSGGSEAAAQSAFGAFKSSIEKEFSKEIKVNVGVSVKARTSSSGDENAEAHANGGIMTRPHLGLVAEDGAEAIIPLSGKRRQRGISLWERAGKLLGIRQYAGGGIIGNTVPEEEPLPDCSPVPMIQTEKPASTQGAVTVPVTIGNISFEIHADSPAENPEKLAEVIKDNVKNLTDEIAYQLALSLQQVFANMPKSAEGV